jgi:hypothetical protein
MPSSMRARPRMQGREYVKFEGTRRDIFDWPHLGFPDM